jgi:formamidopyrimidine-DNA glycosylase
VPELPEVECVRRSLVRHLVGNRIVDARLLRADFAEALAGSGESRPAKRADLLFGAVITKVRRHGKQLALVADSGRVLCVHLGMSGQFLSDSGPLKHTHVHARWTIETRDGRSVFLAFRDPRRFGGLWAFDSFSDLHDLRWSSLGPDALTITARALGAALKSFRGPVKAALLDQSRLAGVGNIYADESLHLADVHPLQPAHLLVSENHRELAGAIRAILRRAVASGGSTLRDYVDADGSPGSYQNAHAVYGRANHPCLRCGTTLMRLSVAQRTTVYCPSCQTIR